MKLLLLKRLRMGVYYEASIDEAKEFSIDLDWADALYSRKSL
jgi:hypothetical protein